MNKNRFFFGLLTAVIGVGSFLTTGCQDQIDKSTINAAPPPAANAKPAPPAPVKKAAEGSLSAAPQSGSNTAMPAPTQ